MNSISKTILSLSMQLKCMKIEADSVIKQFVLAVIIIIPSFGLLGGMLYVQVYSLEYQVQQLNQFYSDSLDADYGPDEFELKKSLLLQVFGDMRESNERFSNMLLPVFAAWVGAVIAFYFGISKNEKSKNNETFDALDILKQRYAKGGINSEEFNKMKKDLQE